MERPLRTVSQTGFTLAEILLAMTLITLVLLVLLGLTLRSLDMDRKSQDLVAGQLTAQQVLGRLVYEAQQSDTAALWNTNSPTLPYLQDQVSNGDSVFNVTVYVTDVSSSAFPSGQRLKHLDARVTWSQQSVARRSLGQLEVRSNRLLHEP